MIDRPLRHWRPGWYVRGWRYGDPMDVSTADGAALVYLITPRETRRREGRHRRHVRVAPGAAPPERLADPGGIPGECQVCRRDRDRHPEVVAWRARPAVVPQP